MKNNPIFRFIRSLYRFIRSFIFCVGLLVVIAVVLLVVKPGTISFESPEYTSTDKIMLKMKLTGELLDKSPEANSFSDAVISFFKKDENQLYAFHMKSVLDRAKKDPQVLGLYLNLGTLQGSLSEFEQLRKLLSEFKDAGKRLEVWTPMLENKTYFLASLADKLHIAPEGEVEVPGPMFQLIYGGEAFRKLGVAFEVIRMGQYKSAFEPLVSDQPSPETQKAYSAIEESLRKHLLSKIAQGRKIELKVAEGWMRRSLFTAKEAFLEKLVDGLSYREQFEDQISKEAKLVEIAKYHKPKPLKSKSLIKKEGIAFIEAIGEMYIEPSAMNQSSTLDFEHLEEQLKWARDEQDVKAVVLRVDSPGGSSIAADLLWEDVRRLAEVKPVVVSMGAYAASGGYYMSASATKIIAHPTTITGSIGVIGLVPNFEAFKQKYGVSFYNISESDRKNLLNPGSKMTAEDRNILQKQVSSAYEAFVTRVANGRKKSFTEIDSVAQGRVWTGAQAKELGLVDELGGLPEAFHRAKELAKLNVDQEYPLLHYKSPENWRFLSHFSLDNLTKTQIIENIPLLNSLSRWMQGVPKEKVLTLLPQRLEMH